MVDAGLCQAPALGHFLPAALQNPPHHFAMSPKVCREERGRGEKNHKFRFFPHTEMRSQGLISVENRRIYAGLVLALDPFGFDPQGPTGQSH